MNRHGKGRLMAIAGRLGAALAAALLVVLGLAVPAFAQGSTTTTVNTSGSPSTVGQSVTFTATVTVTGGPSPTGTVAFSDGANTISGCGGVALDASDMAACTTSALPTGASQTITATYGNDADNSGSFGTVSQTVNAAQGSTTTTVNTSGSPSTVGQSVTFTATVSGSNLAGTVAFSDGANTISGCGSVALNGSGVATCTTTALPTGASQTITATYGNDANNSGSFGTVSQTVNSTVGSTSTVVVTSGSPSTVGQSVTFTATVSGSNLAGTVAFSDGANTISGCGSVALNGSGVATCTTTALPTGASQTITATYGNDANNSGSFGTVSQTVNSTVGSTSTVVVTSGSPSTVGQSVTFTATVSGSNLAGTVAFSDGANTISGCGSVALNGSGVATCTTTALPTGASQTITATYGNDANNTGSNNTVSQTVNALTTTTALGSSQSPSIVGQSVTFTATVTGGSSPTGTVAFSGGGITGCGSQTLNGSGVATCTTSALAAGSNQTITAVYSGDAKNATSTGTVSQTVNTPVVASPSSTTLTSSTNPSTFGQSVSLTATVTPVGGGTPTGTVEFFDGTTVLGTLTLGGSGLSSSALAPNQAELSTSTLSQGAHSITAVYSGDSLANPSTSSPLTQVVNPQAPTLPATTTMLTPAANPAVVGHLEKLTATVSTTSPGGSITGTVQFFEGSILLGTVPLAGNQAVVDVETKVPGTYGLTAAYSGDAANAPSTSPALDLVELGLGQAGTHGYWLVGSDGGIFTFGSAQFYGSTGALTLQRPVVGITPTSDLGGYWLVASDGGIFTFGDAGFFGSIPGLGFAPARTGAAKELNAPIVGMVPSSDGGGYFMVGSDGGVFAFGDAKFEGSCPGIGGCSGAAVTVMPDASGNGYWLVTATGHIYTFGDAAYYGAPGPQSVPVTSAVRTADGKGYWILFSNGVIAGYGDAGNFGSPGGAFGGQNPATAILSTADGQGYWVASANGSVYSYGDAQFEGSMAGTKLNGAIIAATGF